MKYKFSLAIKLGILLLLSFVLILGFNFWQQYDVYRNKTVDNILNTRRAPQTVNDWVQDMKQYSGLVVFDENGNYQEDFINEYATNSPDCLVLITSYNALLTPTGESAYEVSRDFDSANSYTTKPVGGLKVIDTEASNGGLDVYFYVNTDALSEEQFSDFINALKSVSETDVISVSGQKEDIASTHDGMDYGSGDTITSITPSYLQIGETVVIDGNREDIYSGRFELYQDEERVIFPITHRLDYYPLYGDGPESFSRYQTEIELTTWIGIREYSVPKAKEATHAILESYSSPAEYPNTLQEYTTDGDTYFYQFDSFIDEQTNQTGYTLIVYAFQDLNMNIAMQLLSEYSNQFFIATGLVVILTFIILFIIIRPLKKIEKTAKCIANNDFDTSLKVRSHDEMGSLSNSIEEMSKNLKSNMTRLEREIERVKKLENIRKEFIARFTHEIKTPIAIIDGYNELLESSVSDKHRKEYLQIIDRETSNINDLVSSMLALSKLESGKDSLAYQEIDLEDLVIDVIDNHSLLLEQRNIKVHLNTKEQIVDVDNGKIETVIINFLTNAIKHTPRNGNIYITIDDTTLSIENEGSTISPEIMESIWEAFQTFDAKGTGLGLSITRAILELHRFNYGVENTDRGVCFYFIFR